MAKTVELFEILSTVQLGRTDDLCRLRVVFAGRYPAFDVEEFMHSQPIVGTRATVLFLDGVARAGFC